MASHRCKSIAVRVTRRGCLDFFRKLQAHRIDRIIIELNLLPSYSPSAPVGSISISISIQIHVSLLADASMHSARTCEETTRLLEGRGSTVSGTNDDHVTASRHGFRGNAVVSVDYTSERSTEERARRGEKHCRYAKAILR